MRAHLLLSNLHRGYNHLLNQSMRPDPRYARQDLCNLSGDRRRFHSRLSCTTLLISPACYRSIIRAIPFGDAVLQSGAGRVARSAVNAVEAAEAAIGAPAALIGGFQGSAQAFQKAVASQPYLILAALTAAYIILACSTRALSIRSQFFRHFRPRAPELSCS